MNMTRPILNLEQVQFLDELTHGDKFEAKVARIGSRIGAKKLGYNLTVVAPGKAAFPFHNHHANEEMFYVISGVGKLRFGLHTFDVREGDVVSCPAGGPEVAHQFVNTGTEELQYLAVSTTVDTDVFQYPDSGKFGASGGRVFGSNPPFATFPTKFYDESSQVDYWKGE
jgi:uncharacterized cupin superfamily protein